LRESSRKKLAGHSVRRRRMRKPVRQLESNLLLDHDIDADYLLLHTEVLSRKGTRMADERIMDVIMLTVLMPHGRPDGEYEPVRKMLGSDDFLDRLRRAVRALIQRTPNSPRPASLSRADH